MSRDSPGAFRLPDALPPLRGWPRRLFLAAWVTLAMLAGIGIGTFAIGAAGRSQQLPPTAMVGLWLRGDNRFIVDYLLDPQTSRSGLMPGDRIVAVDGHPLAGSRDELYRRLSGPVGSTVAVTVLRPSGMILTRRLTRDPAHERAAFAPTGLDRRSWVLLAAGELLLGALALLGCATLLIVRRGRDALAPWASLALLLLLCEGGPIVQSFLVHFAAAQRIAGLLKGIGLALLFSVLAVFPDASLRTETEARAMAPIALLGLVAGVLDLDERLWLAWEIVASVVLLLLIARRYRAMPPGTARQQIRWALLGFAWALVAQTSYIAIDLLTSPELSFPAYVWLFLLGTLLYTLFSVLIAVALTVSLLRYRLYDADATISRSVAYGTLTVALLAVFAGSEKVIEVLGEEYLGSSLGALAGGLGAAVAAVLVVPLHHRVTHWAEKRFRSHLAGLRHGLPLLVGDLRETAAPAALAEAVLARVERGVRARHVALAIDGRAYDGRDVDAGTVAGWLAANPLAGDPRRLQAARGDALFPLRVPLHADGCGLVGWLLLGPRPDGSFYGREEREALAEIADPVARALAIALERERRETDRQRQAAAQDRELTELRRIVRSLQERFGLGPEPGDAMA